MSDVQKTVQFLLNELVEKGTERGAQVCIYRHGQLLVDAWAGVTDVRAGSPVNGDSLFPVFSTTKGVFSTVIHILVERGTLAYDRPIADYWPEFSANGKAAITVRQALAHTSALPYMPEGVTLEQTADWDYMCRRVAELGPAWEPGTRFMYHPVTFGWILGEVARRADGRGVPQLLEEEICRPLGITRMFCGIPAELEPQTAFLEQEPNPPVTPVPPPNDVSNCMKPLHEWINRPDARRAPQPGCSGIMNARSIARHYAALLPGGVDGVELLPQSRMELALEEQVPSKGYEPGQNGRRGLGYQLGTDIRDVKHNPRAFGHFGHGGSMGFADPALGLGIGIVRNRFSDHPLTWTVFQEIHRLLGVD